MFKSYLVGFAVCIPSISIAAIPLAIETSQPFVETDSPIMYAYNKDNYTLAEVDLLNKGSTELSVPKNALGFDFGKLANSDKLHAFILNNDGIYISTPNDTQLLIKSQSLFNKLELEQFHKMTFTLDANNDGLTDFILPNLETNTLFIQSKDGQFTSHIFNKPNTYTGRLSNNRLQVRININTVPVIADLNNDDKNDLVFYNKESISVLYANQNGYASDVTFLTIPVELGEVADGKQRDLNLVKDINNDGHIDMVTRQSPELKGMDFMDADIQYALYLGKENGQFNKEAISLPSAKGTGQFQFKHDFNGDGKVDLQKFHLDFGFGTIASMALGGGSTDVDVEIGFYKQLENGQFSKKPETEKDIEMEVNMNGGDTEMSLFVGDINGDGKNDAIFKSGSKTLSVYYGEEGKLLAKKRHKIKQKLPKSANDIFLVDINEDGKKDFVFKFTDKKGKSTVKTRLN